ncbi:hypothetical protein BaRGS_00004420 [Batillaria attramentaria]|uniref:Uncharacterized protein n=1 Tax=Batillaria attramentaria TaxID=370345 RepID=A0ABD0LX93_9CAEN
MTPSAISVVIHPAEYVQCPQLLVPKFPSCKSLVPSLPTKQYKLFLEERFYLAFRQITGDVPPASTTGCVYRHKQPTLISRRTDQCCCGCVSILAAPPPFSSIQAFHSPVNKVVVV